ncbi:MAG: NAD(P)H-binding protein [Candidatus Thermoplasmatota archaeon]
MPPPGKLRIAVFGAGGTLGSRIAAEAVARGHLVTPVQRSPGFVKLGAHRVGMRRGDAFDSASVANVAQGHDAVVSAVAPPADKPELLVRAARGLVAGCRAAGVPRLVVVNGAGSLLVPVDPRFGTDAKQLLDTPEFPRDWRPTAVAHRDALAYLKDAAGGLQWTAISPPALIQPGVRTGRYQLGTDRLLKGRDGQSRISAEDYAVAVVDELEKGRFKGKRMTVAWP